MKVFYDGWSLTYQPNSPEAIHLMTLLAAHPLEHSAVIALPGESFHRLPEWVEARFVPTPDSERSRLRWEQQTLPALAAQSEVGWMHAVGSGLPLFGRLPRMVSPAGFSADLGRGPGLGGRRGFIARLRDALSQGGLSRARLWLWPQDLPAEQVGGAVHYLPPAVHPLFVQSDSSEDDFLQDCLELTALDLPEAYILYHGPASEPALRQVLDAWSWAAGSIGENYPLLLVGLNISAQERLAALLAEYQLTGSARPLPPLSLPCLALLYRRCSALFHPVAALPWGDPMRIALACARPIVGLEDERSSALVGPAAYLSSSQLPYMASRRALGAALITVIVEESVAASLSQAARQRSAEWDVEKLRAALRILYAAPR
ncbi:MAG: hypothetical protein QME21_15305 [Anaerolineales bacterium]|nr:hypothetical protein [Anaerolineales bacterium]